MVSGSILNKISLKQSIVQIKLVLKDEIKRIIPNFCNIYYLPNSLLNLISLNLLNNVKIISNKLFTTKSTENLLFLLNNRSEAFSYIY